ncbi:AI-2E family transporter [Acinetobacter puyangensis]|uniref:AI-2E family transporter n=1 Tax=Acinetobacter puyangensis TaxID=1096779 RepID=UPI003A4DE293
MHDPMLKRIFILAGIASFLWVIYLLLPVVLPFVIAFLVAYLFSPLVEKMQKIGLPRWLAISTVFILIIVGLTLVGWFLVPMIWAQLMYARDHIPEMIHWINETFLPWASTTFNLEPMEINTDELSVTVMDYIQTNYSVDNIQDIALRLAQSGLSFIQIGGTLVLVPIIAFYFLLDWERMLQHMRRTIPRPMETDVVQIARECHEVLGAFVKGQFLVMILLGLVYAVGLQLIGLHVGLIIGLVAGLASIIPYLGFAVGIVAAVIASFLQFGMDWVHLALVFLVFMIGQAVEGYILQPFLLGDKIGLSPVAVVFSVLAGAQLLGFAGMLIALPVAAIIVVLLRHLRASYERSRLYGAQPVVTTEHIENIDLSTSMNQDSSHKNTRYDIAQTDNANKDDSPK